MPERIQRRRARGHRMPDGTIYVGRPSLWGNPWTVTKHRGEFIVGGPSIFYPPDPDQRHAHQFAVDMYRQWLDSDIYVPDRAMQRELNQRRLRIIDQAHTLRGRNLSCWCPPGPCHADVLLELANPQEAHNAAHHR